MMSEEDVVPLVMKRHNPLACKLRLVVEKGRHHPGHAQAQPRCEIVQNNLGPVGGDLSPAPELESR